MPSPYLDPELRDTDFRAHPERYRVARGEQGVLTAEPYKSELLLHWRFRTPEIAAESSKALLHAFDRYKAEGDFVGMDMARKFLQMGFTRARRYANHKGGRKHDAEGKEKPQEADQATSEKAESARIFREAYQKANADPEYRALRKEWVREKG
ncbi:DUF4385 domain-containing protein [bacterium]|nr:MAG: DUF4385 domain-containing protein [bacterium]